VIECVYIYIKKKKKKREGTDFKGPATGGEEKKKQRRTYDSPVN